MFMSQMLYRAMDSVVGIIVETDNVAVLQQRLSQLQPKLGEAVACLNIRRSPDNPQGELWILKGGTIPAEEMVKKAERESAIDDVISKIVQDI